MYDRNIQNLPELCHVGDQRGASFRKCDYPGILASKAKDTRSQRPVRKLNPFKSSLKYLVHLRSANYSV